MDPRVSSQQEYVHTFGLSSPTALQGFLEAAPDAIVVVDAEGRIVIVNQLTERMFGYTRQELLGAPVELLVPERYGVRHVEERASYFGEPRTRPMGEGRELAGRRKDGSEFPVEISLSPLKTHGGTLVISIIRDTTERKLVETRLRASLQEKEVLLKEVHHRVKNNLQIVSSMLNLQLDQLSDPKALALFKESQMRVRSIALFHEKLYQSKDLARVDIGEYLKGLATDLFATYGINPDDILLTFATEDVSLGVDAAISCGLIVNELVSNALKHAFPSGRKGEVHITLRRDGQDVVLEVTDDGVGMPADLDLQTPSTLGLKLVAILAEQVRGHVELDRQRGTRFIIRFAHEDRP
ncbi:MAG TPA: histidine kinase dimerization/phosphoacceptor domain -containing protein [Polyangia bacterium]|jgi:PAS domain S-box-containing protein|nr:histidine kinase dimerization/phosphoacceptor domain -containing protein [Polyangia bacterium]